MDANLSKKVSSCLTLALNGDVEKAIEQLSKWSYLRLAFKKLHLKINKNATYDFDELYVQSLTNNQLSNLIRFYTLFETNFYNQHSITAIPYLIELLSQRNYEEIEELIGWTIRTANGQNPYIPFGNLKYSHCKSLSEYHSIK